MTQKVVLVVLACFQWLPYSAVATINIQQKPSARGYYTLLVDFSMLSESCANETIDLISKSYAIGNGGGFSCSELNDTYSKCELGFYDNEYQGACDANGGKFNSSIWTPLGDTVFYTCVRNSNGKFYTTDVSTRDYPFCAGISCNESEIQMAYNATILADASSGELRALAERQCDINPFGKSIAYNRYDGGFSFIYIALTAITITVLIL